MPFRPAFADLSHHNTIADSAWAQAKAAGLVGVILKATEGTSFRDDKYSQYRTKALAAGLFVASYHYLSTKSDPAAQMDFFISVVKPGKGERLVIDFEESGLNSNALIKAANRLFEKAPQCEVTVYSGQSFINSTCGGVSSPDLARTSLWVARYTSATDPGTIPTQIWPTWTAWQYTDGQQGGSPRSVAGFGQCDLNEFNGSRENCALWFQPGEQPAPSPEPEPEVAEVVISTTGHVRVIVNGQVVTYE